MADQLDQPLRTAVSFLETNGYRYAIIGGIALTYWGVVRTTYDVDIKVVVPGLDYAAIRSALRSAFPDTARQAAPQNPLIVSVAIQDVIVDFLLALPGYEEMIIERAELGNLGSWSAWICSAEDLIIQKAVAGRTKMTNVFLVNRVALSKKGPVTEDWTFLSSKHSQIELLRLRQGLADHLTVADIRLVRRAVGEFDEIPG